LGGEYPYLGDLLTNGINHLLNGMILLVPLQLASGKWKIRIPEPKMPHPDGALLLDGGGQIQGLPSRSLTFSPLKNDGWKTTFLLGWYIFRGYVKLPGGIQIYQILWKTTPKEGH